MAVGRKMNRLYSSRFGWNTLLWTALLMVLVCVDKLTGEDSAYSGILFGTRGGSFRYWNFTRPDDASHMTGQVLHLNGGTTDIHFQTDIVKRRCTLL